ncbi:MAG: serine hydrolase domain-containing protein, partial [Bacillota bacterium]
PMTEESKKITLLELATHTSGMPRQPMVPSLLFRVARYEFTGDDFYRQYDTSYILDYLDEFDWSPTDHPLYSNTGYALLGYIIEQRTGKTLQELLQEKIAGPLQLKETGFDLGQLPGHAARARGYSGDEPLFVRRGQPVPDFQLTHMMKSTGGLYSSARDILSFAAACMRDDGSPLSSLLDDTLQVRVPQALGATGIAWFQDQVDGERINYQEGLIGGFSAYVGMDRAHHTAVVVFENSFNWDFTIGHRLLIRMARAEELAGRAVTTGTRAAMEEGQR